MTDKVITWKKVHEDAEHITDKIAEIRRRTEWSEEKVREEAELIQDFLRSEDKATGMRGLLEIVWMREFVLISEELSEELQLALMHVMWLFQWTVDDTKQAIARAASRFGLVSGGVANSIETLREIGCKYRQLKERRLWSDNDARIRCAELMWLMDWDEHTTHLEMCKARERYHYQRGVDGKVLDGLRELELAYRKAPFRERLPESDGRRLAEAMWLRNWSAEKALEEKRRISAVLSLRSERESIGVLNEICLMCGGKERPNAMTEAVDEVWGKYPPSEDVADRTMTNLAEYMWIQNFTIEQTITKVGRFARVNSAPLRETLDILLDLARKQRKEKANQAT